MSDVKVVFDDAADYENYMGRWSRALGKEFLTWLAPPKNASWLDVGCGTGAFSELLVNTVEPRSVNGVDPAPAQIEYAVKHIKCADFRVGDALALPFPDKSFDLVVSALVIHFLPNRAKGFTEMRRVATPGGVVAGYTWQRGGGLADGAPYIPMSNAVRAIGGDVARLPTVPEGAPDALKTTLAGAGFENIETHPITVTQSFRTFDDYWRSQTPSFAPVAKSVLALSEGKREELKTYLRKTLPTAADGSISYPATALAFKARTPRVRS
jgi:SAM-dependent methyltransferase